MKNYKFSEWLGNVNIDLKPRLVYLMSLIKIRQWILFASSPKISNAYKSYPR